MRIYGMIALLNTKQECHNLLSFVHAFLYYVCMHEPSM